MECKHFSEAPMQDHGHRVTTSLKLLTTEAQPLPNLRVHTWCDGLYSAWAVTGKVRGGTVVKVE